MTPHPTIADLLLRPLTDPGRPRLTWYGAGGERIELSAAVLANWVAKTTNLLVEELDAGPGTTVGLDLPAHWRTVVWALSAWRCGAVVVLGEESGGGDVVVSDRPASHPGATALVAVALPALARRFDGDLPSGALDAAGSVMTYGDVVGWAPDVDPDAPALVTDGPGVPHAHLVGWAAERAPVPPGHRVLVSGGRDRADDVAGVLAATVTTLAGEGSLVLLDPDVADELASDADRRDRLVATERVTAEL